MAIIRWCWARHSALRAGTPELKLRLVKCEPKSAGALHVVYRARG